MLFTVTSLRSLIKRKLHSFSTMHVFAPSFPLCFPPKVAEVMVFPSEEGPGVSQQIDLIRFLEVE